MRRRSNLARPYMLRLPRSSFLDRIYCVVKPVEVIDTHLPRTMVTPLHQRMTCHRVLRAAPVLGAAQENFDTWRVLPQVASA
jgi:hypothetical protein